MTSEAFREALPYMDIADDNKEKVYMEFESRLNDFVHLCRAYIDDHKPIGPHKIRLLKLLLHDEENVAVIGDIHGGICDLRSFLLRLREHGFFKDRAPTDVQTNYILKEGKYIVCLGDFVDNGESSLPVAHLLFALKMMPGNNTKVIILNGNHEDYDAYARFPRTGWIFDFLPWKDSQWDIEKKNDRGREWYAVKAGHKGMFTNIANHLLLKKLIAVAEDGTPYFVPFEYLPAALFVRYKTNDVWIQMCHGGIDDNLVPIIKGFLEDDMSLHHIVKPEYRLDVHFSGLKWSDFDDTYHDDINGAEESADCGGHLLNVQEWDSTNSCGKQNERGRKVKTYDAQCTLNYLKHTNIGTIIRGHEDQVRGFMSIPMHEDTQKPDAGIDINVYVFPVARAEIFDNTDGVRTERSMSSCVRRHEIRPLPAPQLIRTVNGEDGLWERPFHCRDPKASTYFVHGRGSECALEPKYNHCVPKDRCAKFAQGVPFAYKFPSKDHAVVTTSSCSQGLKKAQQAFIIIEKSNVSDRFRGAREALREKVLAREERENADRRKFGKLNENRNKKLHHKAERHLERSMALLKTEGYK